MNDRDPTMARHTPAPSEGCFASQSDGDHPATHVVEVVGVCRNLVVSGPPEARVDAIAAAQRGVVSRGQLRAAGLDDSAIARLIARGRLQRLHARIYRVGPVLDVPLAIETAALLACGEGVVLSHRSAATLWELPLPSGGQVEVSIRDRHIRSPVGVTVHRTRTLTDRDVRHRHGLPLTSPARTLLDLADVTAERPLERALDEALVRRIVRRSQLEDVLGRAVGRRGASVISALLEDRRRPTTFTRSEGEERFLALIRAAGLSIPEVNARIHGFEVDFLWRAERLAVEFDGFQFHGTRTAFERDRRKAMALLAAGIDTLGLSWRALEDGPLGVIGAVAMRLGRAA